MKILYGDRCGELSFLGAEVVPVQNYRNHFPKCGVEINERNVGKLYRQFLALLGGTIAHTQEKLTATALEHGGYTDPPILTIGYINSVLFMSTCTSAS